MLKIRLRISNSWSSLDRIWNIPWHFLHCQLEPFKHGHTWFIIFVDSFNRWQVRHHFLVDPFSAILSIPEMRLLCDFHKVFQLHLFICLVRVHYIFDDVVARSQIQRLIIVKIIWLRCNLSLRGIRLTIQSLVWISIWQEIIFSLDWKFLSILK